MNSLTCGLSKSQVFARCIVDLAFSEYGLSVLAITGDMLALLADESLSCYPDDCDVRFRGMAMCRILSYQRYCKRQEVARRLELERLL